MWFHGTDYSQFFDNWFLLKVFEKSFKIGRDYEPWLDKYQEMTIQGIQTTMFIHLPNGIDKAHRFSFEPAPKRTQFLRYAVNTVVHIFA